MSGCIFLSYAHEDQSLVQWEANTLIVAGLDVFLDYNSLRYGSDWPSELINEIRTAERFLLFWSSYAAQSEWVRNEYEEALRVRSSRGFEQYFQIMKLDDTPLPESLGSIQYLDRSREELLIVASEEKKSEMLMGGIKSLFSSGIFKIVKTTPRTTKIIAYEVDALVGPIPSEVRSSFKHSSALPRSMKLSTFVPKDRGEIMNRPIILVPDMMASELAVDGTLVWLNYLKLIVGGMKKLRIDRARVHPTGLVSQIYSTFLRQVESTMSVVPCPYDWRLSFEDSAHTLADTLQEVFEKNPNCKPTLVGHGTGCFVIRALAAFHSELWEEGRKRGVSNIFIGAPENGYYISAETLTESSTFLSMLGKVDLRHTKKDISKIFAAYPSFIQLLPCGPEQDLLDPSFWHGSQFNIDKEALLEARKLRELMANSIKQDEIFYIYGSAESTVDHLSIDKSVVRKRATSHGDGYTSYELAFPTNKPKHLYFADVPSPSVFDNPAVIQAIVDLSNHRTTTILSNKLIEIR